MRKLSSSMLLAFLACYALGASADVKLSIEDNVKVIAINGQEIKNSPFLPTKQQFTLEPGRHVITARYDRLFDLTHNSHDYLKSGNITLSVDLQDNQSYQLIMPNQPSVYSQAKEYAKAPTLALAQNGKIIAQESQSEKQEGILSSLSGLFGRDRDKAVQANQKVVAAVQNPASPSSNTSSATTSVKTNTLDSFMQLWLNASEEEREKIRQWVAK
ncbi:MAG: DUF2057 family protein [Moraxella sp.]